MLIDNENETIISAMPFEVDILENDIREKYPDVLETLLRDHTTQQNIFWATNNYQYLGERYELACKHVVKPVLLS